jgi:hypothetical protein
MGPVRNPTVVVAVLLGALLGGAAAQWASNASVARAQQRPSAGAVRATVFVLVGADGENQAVLEATADGPVLRMKDGRGNERLALGRVPMLHAPTEPAWGMVVRDHIEVDRCAVGAAPGGGLAVWDGHGTMRLGLGGGEAGRGVGLSLCDEEGDQRIGVGVGPGGGGDFVVKDRLGQDVWRASRAAYTVEPDSPVM